MTSHDVVSCLRRIIGQKKIGHTGTLDPMATGVLPVCLGKATRIIEYLDADQKEYVAEMMLGRTYDTGDIWGKPVSECSADLVNQIGEDAVRKALQEQVGVISQYPPMYSAVKVNGRKLYEYAREGKEVERKARTVQIREIEILETDLGKGLCSRVKFRMVSSRGTYVRTVCEEAGKTLGTGAAMSSLVRTRSGIFRISDARTLSEIEVMSEEERNADLFHPEDVLTHLGRIRLDKDSAERFLNGRTMDFSPELEEKAPEFLERALPIPVPEKYSRSYAVFFENIFLGVGEIKDGVLHPAKVFQDKEAFAEAAGK